MKHEPPTFQIPHEATESGCPHCGANDAVLESLFGGSVSEVMLRCRHCRTVFHWVKWTQEARTASRKDCTL